MQSTLRPKSGKVTPASRRDVLAATAVILVLPLPLAAQETPDALVMFRRAGCPYCHAWDREVGPAYPKTEIGAALPLREVDLDEDGNGGIELDRPIRYTPTFVLASSMRELARIEGYPGDEFFWVRLEQLASDAGLSGGPGEVITQQSEETQ